MKSASSSFENLHSDSRSVVRATVGERQVDRRLGVRGALAEDREQNERNQKQYRGGNRGEAETLERNEFPMLRLFENSLVDNSFSAPVAEGCGEAFAFLIDPLIDAKIGLPSASGHNTAILNGELKTATVEAVLANET